MKFLKIILCLLILTQLGGCVLTKVITVPMRVGGSGHLHRADCRKRSPRRD